MKSRKLISLLTLVVMTLSLFSSLAVMADDSAVTTLTAEVRASSRYLGYTYISGITNEQFRIGQYNDWFNQLDNMTSGVTDKESTTLNLKFDISEIVDAGFIKSATIKVKSKQIDPYYEGRTGTLYIDGVKTENVTIASDWVYNTDIYPMTADWSYGEAVTNPKNTDKKINFPWTKVDYNLENTSTYPDFSAYGNYYPNIYSAEIIDSDSVPANIITNSDGSKTGHQQDIYFEYDVTENLKAEKMAGNSSVAYAVVNNKRGNVGGATWEEMNNLSTNNNATSATMTITTYTKEELLSLLNEMTDSANDSIPAYLQAILGNKDSSYKAYSALSKAGKAVINAAIVEAELTDADVLKTVIDEAVAAYFAGGNVDAEDKEGTKTVYSSSDWGHFTSDQGRSAQYRIGLVSLDGVTKAVTFGSKFVITNVPAASLIKSAKVSYTVYENNPVNPGNYTYKTNLYPMTTEWPEFISPVGDSNTYNAWLNTASSYDCYPNLSGLSALDSATAPSTARNAAVIFEYDVTEDLKAKKALDATEIAYTLGVERPGGYQYGVWSDDDCLIANSADGRFKATIILTVETYNEEYLIKNLDNVDDTDVLYENLKAIIGASDSAVKAYNKLTDNGKEAVMVSLKTASYINSEELKAALENAIAEYLASPDCDKNDKPGNTVLYSAIDYGSFTTTRGIEGQYRIGMYPSSTLNSALESFAAGIKFNLGELADAEYIKDVELVFGTQEGNVKVNNLTYYTDVYPMTTQWPTGTKTVNSQIAFETAKEYIDYQYVSGSYDYTNWPEAVSEYTGYPNITVADIIDSTDVKSKDSKAYIDFSYNVTDDIKEKIANTSTVAYAIILNRYNNEAWWQDDNGLTVQDRNEHKLNVTYISDELILDKYNSSEDKEAVLANILKIEDYKKSLAASDIIGSLAETYSTYTDLITDIYALSEIEITASSSGYTIENKTSKNLPVYIFAAAYKGNKLVEAVTLDETSEIAGKASATFSPVFTETDYDKAYIFCWDGSDTIKPYCENADIK